MRKLYFVITTFFFFSLILVLNAQESHAAGKFETTITREYYVQKDLSVKVTETEKIVNNTSNLYIPSGSEKKFDILAIEIGAKQNKKILSDAVKSAKLTYNGANLAFTTTSADDMVTLNAKFPSSLESGKTATFVLEYVHPGMVEKNGALMDIFLNGFAESSVFSDVSNDTIYLTNIYVPKSFQRENFALPDSHTKKESGKYIKYSFSQSSLIGHYVWIQLGREQFYQFTISQKINSSENLNTGNKNEYEIVIPRSIDEAQVTQTIYYTNISPKPEWVKLDDEGNLLASFRFSSNFDGAIVLEGYADLKVKNGVNLQKLGSLNQIDKNFKSKYVGAADYWEVNDPTIVAQADKLKGSQEDIYKLVSKTYNFVVNRIDYSQVKRFGLNERQGAVKTLQGGAAVCMEYSDLFLTLARAQGLPTRAAFGYGYDPKLPAESQEAHQWVEVYSPTLDEWVSVDVTWGESGPALIGGDLNHFYTHVASISPNDPPGIASVGFGDLNLETASYDIEVLESIPSDQSLLSEEDVLQKYDYNASKSKIGSFDVVQSKIDAIITNILEGQRLAPEQIIILVLLLAGGGIIFLSISKFLFSRLRPNQKVQV